MNTRDHFRIGRRLTLSLLAAAPLFAQCPTGTLYPGALDTNASLTVAKNNIVTTLTVQQQIPDTVLIVASATGWAANMMATVDTGTAVEYEFVTSVVGMNTLNVTRACEGSAAVIHVVGASVANVATAYSGHTSLTGAVTAVETLIKAAPTAHSVPVAEGASPFNYLAPGTAGQLFTSNGASADPTFQAFGPGSGLPAGAQTQQLQIQPNTGNNTTLQFTSKPVAYAVDYAFPAQSPGGSLSVGNNSVTFTPVPNGVNGTDTAHVLYVSGGTGTAEACLITGGSGTQGQASGSIIINCVNTHTGAWTVQSATGGIQEAMIFVGSGATIFVPTTSPATLHGAVTIPLGTHYAFMGTSTDTNTPSVIRAADYPTGDLFFYTGITTTPASIGFDHFGFNNLSTGSSVGIAVHMITGNLNAVGLFCQGGVMLALDSTNNTEMVNFAYFFNSAAFTLSHAILISGANTSKASTNGRLSNGFLLGAWLGAGIEITGADTWDIDTVVVAGMQTLVLIDPPAGGQYVTNLRIHGGKMDAGSATNPTTEGIKIVTGATVIIGSIAIEGVDFLGYGVAAEAFAIDAGTSNAGYLADIKIHGCHIFSWNVGIGVGQFGFGGGRSFIISNNTVVGGLSHGITLNTPINPIIIGNHIAGNGGFGISITGATTNMFITGNNFLGGGANTSGAINAQSVWGGTTSVIITNNMGIDDVIPAVASAATLPFPFNPIFTVTGTTNVTAESGLFGVGQRGSLTATGGTITFTAGASIGNSFIAQQNVPVSWYFDGTKVWLGAQTPALSNTYNYISTETGANNAIAGTLTGVTLGTGLRVTIQLAHTLQVGANTFALNGGGAVAIKSSRNTANNIATAYAASASITLNYDGTQWEDVSQ
jgi:hypothetical protein